MLAIAATGSVALMMTGAGAAYAAAPVSPAVHSVTAQSRVLVTAVPGAASPTPGTGTVPWWAQTGTAPWWAQTGTAQGTGTDLPPCPTPTPGLIGTAPMPGTGPAGTPASAGTTPESAWSQELSLLLGLTGTCVGSGGVLFGGASMAGAAH